MTFVVITVNLLIQYEIVSKITDLFYDCLLTSFVNLVACITIMFFVGFGIINVVWSIIFTGVVCGYLLANFFMYDIKDNVTIVHHIREFGKRKELIETIRKEADKYLKITVQAYLALAGSIGVSMSILFNKGAEAWKQTDYQSTAVVMVVAFSLVSIGALFAIVKPYLEVNIRFLNYRKNFTNAKI